ncbi:translation elongation factor [Fervidicella metallireducens AeB]|uniref:Selenocysteine-specific elongation factor n=1 Tax=Fervidicella metallireducens AeB TaxID=1403537 RepID=A0A017RV57_9CLOT|nr:selenocysteine-specific translation elongation factor [Fervidicella metallireducens]EYE88486.1 translation elongation factor [Fervidicella metallireducens AeB]
MQHIIIGTAGHIDHGKTTLIKSLTGRETDTLKEEKERGITINLGFTYFDLPSGRRAGIVDVPGHEKFIKNMLAGVSGIDIVLLVIAADEGIMPQTREHLNILELLDIDKGIVVVTKTDLVDEEWLTIINNEIKNALKNSFLKDAPIVNVSSRTGNGINELISILDEQTRKVRKRNISSKFRVPIDRVFGVNGFGTVITGTLIEGRLNLGEQCEIFTSRIKTRIRNIQVHGENVKSAEAGQRVAINLLNVKVSDVKRGDVLSSIDNISNSLMIDCRLKYLEDAPKALKNRDRVRLYHGTSEVLARVVILDKEFVDAGESALVQLRLEYPIAAKYGDKFIIRSYSPIVTIGGGRILDANPLKHKSFDRKVIEELHLKETGSGEDIIERLILNNSSEFLSREDIKKHIDGIDSFDEIIDKLVDSEKIVKINSKESELFIHRDYFNSISKKAYETLDKFHKQNPLSLGMPKEDFKIKVFDKNIKQKILDEIICKLNENILNVKGNYIFLKDFYISLNEKQTEIKNKILCELDKFRFQPPKVGDYLMNLKIEGKEANQILNYLVDIGEVIEISDDIYIKTSYLNEAETRVIDYIQKNGNISVAQFRDDLSISRKYAVMLLEFFDTKRITKRVGDVRILNEYNG